MSTGRIPTEFEKLVPYLQLTDNYQLADDPDNPGQPRWKKWKWENTESTKWTEFRTRADALFIDYNATNFVNKDVRDKIKILIREVQEYDHDRDTGHKLLDKVGMYGNVDDCNTFRVVRGTALQDETPTDHSFSEATKPLLAMRNSSGSIQELTVTNPDTPKSRALPQGTAFCDVYRYINTVDLPPKSLRDYDLVGVSSRGLFLSDFSAIVFDHTKKYCSWHVARYRGKSGEIGALSNELVQVIDDLGTRGVIN